MRWLAHLRDSSTIVLHERTVAPMGYWISICRCGWLCRVKLTAHHPALVVKVAEDNVDTLVLLAEQVLNWNLDIVKRDVGCAGSGRIGSLDRLGLDSFSARDKDHAQVLACADTSDKVIGEAAVCNPLLCAIDNLQGWIMLAMK